MHVAWSELPREAPTLIQRLKGSDERNKSKTRYYFDQLHVENGLDHQKGESGHSLRMIKPQHSGLLYLQGKIKRNKQFGNCFEA